MNKCIPPRRWTPAEMEFLRANFDSMTMRQIGAALNRSRTSVGCKAKKHGWVQLFRFTAAEDRVIREAHAAGEPMALALPRLPGRTLTSVYQRRVRLGLAMKQRKLGRRLDSFIRAKHALQWCDVEIADEWTRRHGKNAIGPVSRGFVSERRRAMNLPPNDLADRYRRRVAAKTREQLARAGLSSMAQLRIKSHRQFARDSGWPQDLRLRETQILNLIWDRGPLTKFEMCRALGLPFRGARNTLVSNDKGGTHMATLMRRGLLISFRRAVRTGRRGGNVDLYSLAPDIQRRKVDKDVEQQRRFSRYDPAQNPGSSSGPAHASHRARALGDRRVRAAAGVAERAPGSDGRSDQER